VSLVYCLSISISTFEVSNDFVHGHINHWTSLFCYEDCEN